MENRKRNIQMKFYVTEEEKRLIDEKMTQLPIKQYGAYFRKMAIDGYILVVDRSDTKAYAAKHEKQFMKLLIEQNEDGGKRRNAAKRKELDAAEKRIAELSAIFKRLYEDSVTGRISDERFAELSADYEAEQKQVKSRAAELQAELAKAQEATVNAEKFMKVVRKYTSFEELTHTLLREFIEKIVVHECSYDENGTRRQDIDIYYSFVGKVELPDE